MLFDILEFIFDFFTRGGDKKDSSRKKKAGPRRKAGSSRRKKEAPKPGPPSRSRGADETSRAAQAPSSPGRSVSENFRHGPVPYDPKVHGQADASYAPTQDDEADPGEVVWAWIPYEEDPTRGKDRPVVVLARLNDGGVVVAQMTTRDRGRGRVHSDIHHQLWYELGSGPWDSRGRESEARIDRLLAMDARDIRREGSFLPPAVYTDMLTAIRNNTHYSL